MKTAIDSKGNQSTAAVQSNWSISKSDNVKSFWEAIDQQLTGFDPQKDNPIDKIRTINRDILTRMQKVDATSAAIQEFAKSPDAVFQSIYGYRNVIKTLADCYTAMNQDLNDAQGLAKRLTQKLCLNALTSNCCVQHSEREHLLTQAHRQIEEQMEFILFNILYQAGKA